MKKNKNNLILISILAFLPILYFSITTWYVLDIFTIKLHTDLGYEVEEILQMHDVFNNTLFINGIFIAIYVLLLILLFINIKLYKQSSKTIMIIFNFAILGAAIISYILLKTWLIPLMFIILAAIFLLTTYKIKK